MPVCVFQCVHSIVASPACSSRNNRSIVQREPIPSTERRQLKSRSGRDAALAGTKRPLLEVTAAPVAGERDDPEIAIGAPWGIAVDHIQACDGGAVLGGHDLRAQREHLVGPLALVLPEAGDRVQPGERLVERGRLVGRVVG